MKTIGSWLSPSCGCLVSPSIPSLLLLGTCKHLTQACFLLDLTMECNVTCGKEDDDCPQYLTLYFLIKDRIHIWLYMNLVMDWAVLTMCFSLLIFLMSNIKLCSVQHIWSRKFGQPVVRISFDQDLIDNLILWSIIHDHLHDMLLPYLVDNFLCPTWGYNRHFALDLKHHLASGKISSYHYISGYWWCFAFWDLSNHRTS